ncbi:hypothetical protein LI148_17150 [Colidextribacter sp. 210702-DFI.3.9]|nr:hypothetical protein [Colidextribacter sp. 210702-DFI.3.9]
MKNEKNRMKWVAALWTAAAVIWSVLLLVDVVYDRHVSGGLVLLHLAAAGLNIAAAWLAWRSYRRD